MRIALVAPPFIPVPPVRYGGTELFVADLARGLAARGHQVVVYANGESVVPKGVHLRSMFPKSHWPIDNPGEAMLMEFEHTAWACRDAAASADVVHVNNAAGVVLSQFGSVPAVLTLHHSKDPLLSSIYARHPDVTYVAISRAQQREQPVTVRHIVHHGIDLDRYPLEERKGDHLAFLGRMTPEKAPHLAIEAARMAGRPLMLAGEIQPAYREYWETMVVPRLDTPGVEYVGEADLGVKRRLLGGAAAMLFPIQWDEPFGLVMLESMACGTPVIAFGRGSAPEVVVDGVSGWICRDLAEMAARAAHPRIAPASCRAHVASAFTTEHMVRGYEEIYQSIVAAERKARAVAAAPLFAPTPTRVQVIQRSLTPSVGEP